MKRRHILFFIFLLILPFTLRAASEYESEIRLGGGIIGTAGTSATYEISPSKLFQREANFGQDLYTHIYKRVRYQASDVAITQTIAKRQISKEELALVIPGLNIGELLAKQPKSQLTPEEVARRGSDLKETLEEEKKLADLEVGMKMEVEQTELFADGDESNSGFDLLVDLDIIDAILFGKSETSFTGTGPGAPAGSSVADAGGQQSTVSSQEAALSAKPSSLGTKVSPTTTPPSPSPEEAEITCPLQEDFNSAVIALRTAEKKAPPQPTGGSQPSAGGAGAGAAAGVGAEEEAPPPAEKPADWNRPLPCDDFFCLTFEARYKKESSYLANANCIACHFEKINDAFKKTLDHNLVPSKATGNLMEGPKCKSSMFNLKWNAILIPQPILTPPNDDLVVKGDFLKNFADAYAKWGPRKEKGASDPTTSAAKRLIEQAPEGKDIQSLISEIRSEAARQKDEAETIMLQSRAASEASNYAMQFGAVMEEIDAMNAYFESFMNLFNQIVAKQEEAPCAKLLHKEICS